MRRAIRSCDRFFIASAFDERCVFFFDDHFLHSAEHVESDFLEFDAELFADELAACEDRDIFQHRFAAIAKARSFDSDDFKASAEAVDDESCKCFAFDIFSDDEKRFSRFCNCLENREKFFHRRDFFLVDEDKGIFEIRILAFLRLS